jgi:hypothetical protein
VNLLVCRYDYEAKRAIRRAGLTATWEGTGIFSGLCGERFDRILVAENFEGLSTLAKVEAVRIISEYLPCRLHPDGKIERVHLQTLCVAIG